MGGIWCVRGLDFCVVIFLGSDVEGSIDSLRIGSIIMSSWRRLLGSKEVLLVLLLSFMLGLGGSL